MFAKIYLLIVAGLYLGLSLWCSFAPATTSEKVGFQLKGGSGESEFLTVYGGLEFGLALVLIYGVVVSTATSFSLVACLLIHAALVVFRSISLFRFADLEPITYKLAIGEWAILILGLIVLFTSKESQ